MLQIWLKGSSKWFQFPVIPAEYTVSSDSGNESVTVNALGEVDLGGKTKIEDDFVFLLLSEILRYVLLIPKPDDTEEMRGNDRGASGWNTA